MKAKHIGSNAETPVPRKVNLFENPYKELGTDSIVSRDPRLVTADNQKSHHTRDHPMFERKMSFFAESQESLLGEIAEQKAQTSGNLLQQHLDKQKAAKSVGRVKSEIQGSKKDGSEAGDQTIMFDAAEEDSVNISQPE